MTRLEESLIRSAFRPARLMEPTDAEVARALTATGTSSISLRRRTLAVAASALIVISGGAYAVPVTRGAMANIADSFAGWIAGDNELAPGQAVEPNAAPDWLRNRGGTPRLIAQADGVGLYAVREAEGSLSLELNGSVGIADSIEGWRHQLADHAVVVLGPGGITDTKPFDEHGRRPLFGLTGRNVARVVLRYGSGPPLVAGGLHGGFVLLADPRRPLRDVSAYDARGRQLERVDVSDIDLRVCPDVRGCPPGAFEP
jgi:hypothetical protein